MGLRKFAAIAGLQSWHGWRCSGSVFRDSTAAGRRSTHYIWCATRVQATTGSGLRLFCQRVPVRAEAARTIHRPGPTTDRTRRLPPPSKRRVFRASWDGLASWAAQMLTRDECPCTRTGLARCLGVLGKTLSVPTQGLAQTSPIEARSRILLSTWGDVLMSSDMRNRVPIPQLSAQVRQCFVLRVFEGVAFQAFEFNANRIVVAVVPFSPGGCAGVPSPGICVYELNQLAIPTNKKVGRDFHAPDALEVGMGRPVQLIGEELLDFGSSVSPGWQADRMHNDQVNASVMGTRAEVR